MQVCRVAHTVRMAHMHAQVHLMHLQVTTPQLDRTDHWVHEEYDMRRLLLDLSGPHNQQALLALAGLRDRLALTGLQYPSSLLLQAADLLAVASEYVLFALLEAQQVQPAHMDHTHQVDPTYGSFRRCVMNDESELKLEFRKRQLVASNPG